MSFVLVTHFGINLLKHAYEDMKPAAVDIGDMDVDTQLFPD
jgi:hypothetical protein